MSSVTTFEMQRLMGTVMEIFMTTSVWHFEYSQVFIFIVSAFLSLKQMVGDIFYQFQECI